MKYISKLKEIRFYPYFKNCLGAIDGTHIPISISSDKAAPFRNRKNTLSQNVMIACDFDLNITFVSTGWEGSATDARVLTSAVNKGFQVPHGKFYLVDVNMLGRGSPRLTMMLSKAAQKNSPKCCPTKKHGGSPIEKSRASWNPTLEKILVELLHEHNTPKYRGQNGWTSEAWNKIVKEFHDKDRYACFTKAQIQEKEKELKREYRMLKEARKQSGASWNNQRCMIEAEPAIWNNIITSLPKAKKFRTKSFPLFEALGELYDGHNFTSTQPSQHPVITQIESDQDELGNTEIIFPDYEDTFAYQGQDDTDAIEDDNANVERLKEMSQRRVVAAPRNKEKKEPKKQKKSVGVEGLMERYLDMRTKQAEDEAAQLAREKEAHLTKEKENNDFSIKKCISIINSMVEVTREEKAKAYTVFKNGDNKEIFVSACEEDAESALSWLRSEVA